MNALEDEVNLRYHRGLKPDVYYRCPTLESLDGALRSELQKSAESFIPVKVVTEFVFTATSSITIPVTQQANLDDLIQPADIPQSSTAQRAVARSFIEAVQEIDRFKYAERHLWGSSRDRKSYAKKELDADEDDEDEPKKRKRTRPDALPTYDCGGAIHLKFSTKREAINIVYKHNPIHRNIESRPTNSNNTSPKKKRRSRKTQESAVHSSDGVFRDPDLNVSASPEASRGPAKRNRPPVKSHTKKPPVPEPEPEPVVTKTFKPGACVRCREKKMKCNKANPMCNQCRCGLWTSQYPEKVMKKRSKNGCLSCKQRRRKCTEEHPSCAYCLNVNDDCEYPDEY
ncbi:hypothetical protein P154DRAFT_556761 [Amniculicola lignicola CBS 123094]|uniref:Zn(2)-C6 fungal-type domain-containing protein n=1 Tax=Amniculicola lignicola CBS 123094 TaxID=1392246 RepID=A0A6A5WCY0_9PLEO|nr:hypothetical protein P154DRAFT_556761 [Amniculicola lignicola CBS 123094]